MTIVISQLWNETGKVIIYKNDSNGTHLSLLPAQDSDAIPSTLYRRDPLPHYDPPYQNKFVELSIEGYTPIRLSAIGEYIIIQEPVDYEPYEWSQKSVQVSSGWDISIGLKYEDGKLVVDICKGLVERGVGGHVIQGGQNVLVLLTTILQEMFT